MKRLLLGLVIGAMGFAAYQRVHEPAAAAAVNAPIEPQGLVERPDGPTFVCDGRTHCSQMTSCEEATYFLQHCPGVKMDGENDGIPCERQWCGQH